MDEITQCQLFQRPSHYLIDDPLVGFDGAAPLEVAQSGNICAAFRKGDWSFQRSYDFGDRNVFWLPRQTVTTVSASM